VIATAVLDASAFDVIDTAQGAGLRHLLRGVVARGGDVRVAAVTLAEVSRGASRTSRAAAAVARDRGGARVVVVPTDERLARLVGSVLHSAGRGSENIADAHVVAVCGGAEAAVVVTSDPDAILALAAAIPATSFTVRVYSNGEGCAVSPGQGSPCQCTLGPRLHRR
jgi:predicted nucleic acid-binding protein